MTPGVVHLSVCLLYGLFFLLFSCRKREKPKWLCVVCRGGEGDSSVMERGIVSPITANLFWFRS